MLPPAVVAVIGTKGGWLQLFDSDSAVPLEG